MRKIAERYKTELRETCLKKTVKNKGKMKMAFLGEVNS
jgi:hypothetical protein